MKLSSVKPSLSYILNGTESDGRSDNLTSVLDDFSVFEGVDICDFIDDPTDFDETTFFDEDVLDDDLLGEDEVIFCEDKKPKIDIFPNKSNSNWCQGMKPGENANGTLGFTTLIGGSPRKNTRALAGSARNHRSATSASFNPSSFNTREAHHSWDGYKFQEAKEKPRKKLLWQLGTKSVRSGTITEFDCSQFGSLPRQLERSRTEVCMEKTTSLMNVRVNMGSSSTSSPSIQNSTSAFDSIAKLSSYTERSPLVRMLEGGKREPKSREKPQIKKEIQRKFSFDEDLLEEALQTPISTKKISSFKYSIEPSKVQVFGLLGEGTFGTCYRAMLFNEEISWKELNCKFQYDTDLVKQFEKEVESLCLLNHRNIVNVKGASIFEPLSVVTNYIDGYSLSTIIKNQKQDKINFYERLIYAKQIAEGIEYLHQNNIVFNGLKPSNVIVTHRNEIILRDFGLHCIKNYNRKNKSLDYDTAKYIAPEQLRSPIEEHTISEDVYSFGILLWELFSGQDAYNNLSDRDAIDNIINGFRPSKPFNCPLIVWKLMESCWISDIHQRPSFTSLLRVLNQSPDRILTYSGNNTNGIELTSGLSEKRIENLMKKVIFLLKSNNTENRLKGLAVIASVGTSESSVDLIIELDIFSCLKDILQVRQWKLREACARCLGILCRWAQCKKEMKEKGLIIDLIDCLQQQEDLVIIQIAKAIISLVNDPDYHKIVSEYDILQPLLNLLDYSNDIIRLHSVWIISILVECQLFRDDLIQSGGLRKLIMLLDGPNTAIKFRLFIALGNLAIDDNLIPIIEKARVFPQLLKYIYLVQSQSQLRVLATKAVLKFSNTTKIRRELVKCGAPEIIIQLINPEKDNELITLGLNCLKCYIQDEIVLQGLDQIECIKNISSVFIEESSKNILLECIQIISLLIEDNSENKEYLCKNTNIIVNCLNILNKYNIEKDILLLLRNLSDCTYFINNLTSTSITMPLFQLPSTEDLQLKIDALNTITILCTRFSKF